MNAVSSRLKRWPFTPEQSKSADSGRRSPSRSWGPQVSLVAFPLAAIFLLHAGTGQVGLIAARRAVRRSWSSGCWPACSWTAGAIAGC